MLMMKRCWRLQEEKSPVWRRLRKKDCMKTRLITAAVGVPFLIFTLVVRGWFAEFVIVALTFIAMYETYRALKKGGICRLRMGRICRHGGDSGRSAA